MATTVRHGSRGSVDSTGSTNNPMGARKTLIIMVTVVGCIAILWPKVFYPMIVGPGGGGGGGVGAGGQFKPNLMKDHRGSGCCDVVLDQEKFANASINVANQHDLFRKRNIGPVVEDGSIRQERPPHLRPETIHPAMRERGRAIPHVGSVHSERPQSPPRIVEGRPGPIPGMRPPMGAGSHQSTKSVNSMGFIMPLYTIGIVSFFIYTILKLIFKKTPAAPYPEIKPDSTFREEVFTQDQYIKRPDSGKTKLVVTAIQGLISAADEQLLKIDNIKKSAANNLSKETEETDNTEPATTEKAAEPSNGNAVKPVDESTVSSSQIVDRPETERPQEQVETEQEEQEAEVVEETPKVVQKREVGAVPKKSKTSKEDHSSNSSSGSGISRSSSTMKVIPMEKKAAYEPGQHQSISRPTSPVQSVTLDSSIVECDASESKCVLLETKVPQTSKVLVVEPERSVETLGTTTASTRSTEEDTPFDLNLVVVFESVSNLNQGRSLELNVLLGSEPTTTVVNPSSTTRVASPTREVVLSGKMKLSLVKLDDKDNKSSDDVVVKAKSSSDKNPSRFGPNEE